MGQDGGGGGEVELYSSAGCSPESVMAGPNAHQSFVLFPIWHPREIP